MSSQREKHEFIISLLQDKRLNYSQRERILKLSTKELKAEKNNQKEIKQQIFYIEKRIQVIENTVRDKIFDSNSYKMKVNNTLQQADSDDIKYIDPSTLYKYLFKYNQNKILKTTCHDIDSGAMDDIINICQTETYSFEKHLELILDEHNKHARMYCRPSTKAIIRGYLTGNDYEEKPLKKGWSSDEIMINWSSPELANWCKEHKMPPNSSINLVKERKNGRYSISSIESKVFGVQIQTFRELVLHFKKLFHIRFDNSLRSILIHKNQQWAGKIDFIINENEFPENIELFTDVDKLIQAYNIGGIERKVHFKDWSDWWRGRYRSMKLGYLGFWAFENEMYIYFNSALILL